MVFVNDVGREFITVCRLVLKKKKREVAINPAPTDGRTFIAIQPLRMGRHSLQ
jgi:hypothetical protein